MTSVKYLSYFYYRINHPEIFMKNFYFVLLLLTIDFISGCNDNPEDPDGNQVAEYTQIDFEPAAFPDGNKILYIHNDVNYEFTGLYVLDLSTVENQLLYNSNVRCPDLSNDLSRIAYSQNNFLMKMNINADSQQVLRSTGMNYYPKWNSDGSRILYSDISNSSSKGIRLIDSDGENDLLLVPGGNFPEWKDNSNTILYLKSFKDGSGNTAGDTLYEYRINENLNIFIYVLQGDEHIYNSYLNYSGGDIVFCSTSKTGYSYIYRITNSGNLEKLTITQGWSPCVNSSSGKIYYTNRNRGNGRLWEMNRDGSGKKQITF